jgi:hypothetical protein
MIVQVLHFLTCTARAGDTGCADNGLRCDVWWVFTVALRESTLGVST